MKLHQVVVAMALTLCASPAFAQSAFDGTWKADTSTATFNEKPFEFRLKDGIYHCGACTPAVEVKADGAFHKVTGHDGFDEVSIKANTDGTLTESYRKAGKVTSTGTDTISADGNTLTYSYVDTSGANGAEVKGTVTMLRASGAAPAGLHPINGLWKTGSVANVSDAGVTVMLKVVGDTVTESFLTGETATATFGGPAVPIKGDTAGGRLRATRGGDGSITLIRVNKAGKDRGSLKLLPAADGKTIDALSTEADTGNTTTFKFMKQ